MDFTESNGGTSTESCESSSTAPSLTYHDCWISFGGNIGDVKATFDAALALLSLHCHIRLGRRSGIYSTAPMGSQAGTPFLNSVCELSTCICPRKLLGVLQSVETQLGRLRDIRWGPRTLDLDLLSYGNQIICDPDLIVPHPALTYRRFVLDPLIEVAPHWRHPQFPNDSADRLLARLNARPLMVSLPGVAADKLGQLATQLSQRFPQLKLVDVDCSDALIIQTAALPPANCRSFVDLRRSPGDLFEQLTSAMTAIFDAPERISDW